MNEPLLTLYLFTHITLRKPVKGSFCYLLREEDTLEQRGVLAVLSTEPGFGASQHQWLQARSQNCLCILKEKPLRNEEHLRTAE